MKPLIFKPRLVEKVWGGTSLEKMIRGTSSDILYGEAWCLSPLPGQESIVESGELAGLTINEALRAWNKEDPCIPSSFPLLIKLLEAQTPLSLQVHPSDAEAQRNGDGPTGKAEAWYVLHGEHARVYQGIKEKVTRSEFEEALRAGTAIDLCREISVCDGDIVPIPPGTVHTAWNMVWAEVQQASDVTYRLYDWGRTGRELHVEKGLKSIRHGEPEIVREAYSAEWFSIERVDVSGAITAQHPLEAWLSLKDGTTYLLAKESSVEVEGPFLRIR